MQLNRFARQDKEERLAPQADGIDPRQLGKGCDKYKRRESNSLLQMTTRLAEHFRWQVSCCFTGLFYFKKCKTGMKGIYSVSNSLNTYLYSIATTIFCLFRGSEIKEHISIEDITINCILVAGNEKEYCFTQIRTSR